MSQALRLSLEELHDKAPRQVQLVVENGRVWQRIIAQADVVDSWQSIPWLSHAQEQGLRDLAEGVRRTPNIVDSWQGAARDAFDTTLNSISRRLNELAEISTDQRTLANVIDALIRETSLVVEELVSGTIKYLSKTLQAATGLAVITNGTSLTQWTITALIAIRRTLRLLESCVRQAETLRQEITSLANQLAHSTQQNKTALDEIILRLG